jgi:hypothetical protein
LVEQLQITDKLNTEFKRTIGFLEETAEAGKSTINDLRESLKSKEKTIEEFL